MRARRHPTALRLQELAKSWHPVAELYAMATLDVLIELARAVAYDAVRRVAQYREIPDRTSGMLESLRSRVGSEPDWPSAVQRSALYTSLLGAEFCAATIAWRTSAFAAARVANGSGNPQIREAFGESSATGRAYFGTFDGRALTRSAHPLSAMFTQAAAVLKSPAVAGSFGVGAVVDGDWPLSEAVSGSAGYLVESIRDELGVEDVLRFVTRHKSMLLQRAAFRGGDALARLLAAGSTDGEALLQAAYLWETSLQELLQSTRAPAGGRIGRLCPGRQGLPPAGGTTCRSG